jgi:hypothetical protein
LNPVSCKSTALPGFAIRYASSLLGPPQRVPARLGFASLGLRIPLPDGALLDSHILSMQSARRVVSAGRRAPTYPSPQGGREMCLASRSRCVNAIADGASVRKADDRPLSRPPGTLPGRIARAPRGSSKRKRDPARSAGRAGAVSPNLTAAKAGASFEAKTRESGAAILTGQACPAIEYRRAPA